jgi:KUP system potassium uptake protein
VISLMFWSVTLIVSVKYVTVLMRADNEGEGGVMQLGLVPPVTVRQTSEHEGGQVYLPAVNGLLFVAVLAVMLAFGSSARLATAFGVSVTGALVVDTLLLLMVSGPLWHWPRWKVALAAVGFGGVELTFLSANLSKLAHGGWLPLLIAAVVFTVMTTWLHGRRTVAANRREKEGSLQAFVEEVREQRVPRVDGTAVFPHPGKDTTPLALRANIDHNHVLHRNVVIVSATATSVPHVHPSEACTVDDLGYEDDGIQHVSLRFGFSDAPNLPGALEHACSSGLVALPTEELREASYFISRGSIRRTRQPGMAGWRKALFVALAHNAADPAAYFDLPPERTVTMGRDITI